MKKEGSKPNLRLIRNQGDDHEQSTLTKTTADSALTIKQQRYQGESDFRNDEFTRDGVPARIKHVRIKIHRDSSYPLAYHFRGRKSNMRPVFDELANKLSREMKFEFKIGKTYVCLINRLVFAAVRVQTRKLVFEFVSRKEFKNPRIVKSVRVQRAR